MDTFEFISSLTKSLSWPIVTIVVVIILKKPLKEILSNINTLTYKDLQMNFSEKLNMMETDLENKEIQSDNSFKSNYNSTKVKETEIEREKDKNIISIADISPSASIAMSWTMLEKEISNTIVKHSLSKEKSQNNTINDNIKLLSNSGLLDFDTIKIIDELRYLRNKAVSAHISDKVLTSMEAKRYHHLSKNMVKILNEINN